jgi:NADH dehydrogenase [ubiquinone] 1 alpha subcomplex assembly factor 7
MENALIAYVVDNGPITVAEYMARSNAHYYAIRDPLGAKGDFITAPEISQIFGELVGAWCADSWERLGTPQALLCEVGPGRGTLMKDALRATRNIPSFHDKIDICLVETSPTLRQIQNKNLQGAHPRISWQDSLDNLPPLPLIIIANEFFDALPIEQFVKQGDEWEERKIGYKNNALFFFPEGGEIRETSTQSLAIMATIARHIKTYGGAALIIDYGYNGGLGGDSLQAVKQHEFIDVLQKPGEIDLTAHVDFDALLQTAANEGTRTFGAVEQGLFLKRLGVELRATALCKNAPPHIQHTILSGLERLVAPHQMGSLFKVIAVTSLVDKPAGF